MSQIGASSVGAVIAAVVAVAATYIFIKWFSYVSQQRALSTYYKGIPGFGVNPPAPVHPIFGHMASWVDPKLRAEGLGLPVDRLLKWGDYALDREKFPQGNKFLKIQMMGPYLPMSSEALFILDVDVLKDALVATAESKVAKGRSYRIAAPIIGNGILANQWGEEWKHQRKLVEVAFRLENLKYSHKQVAKSAMRLLDRWRQRYDLSQKSGVPGWFDLRSDMLRTTMDVICQVGFGRDFEVGAERSALFELEKETYTTTSLKSKLKTASKSVELDGEPLHDVFKEVLTTMADVSVRINPLSFLSDKKKNYDQRIELLDKVVYRVIDQRLARVRAGDRGRDGTLLDAIADIDEHGDLIMTKKLMGDELKTLLFAGHDTTGNALTWALYRLAVNPEHLKKLRHEVDNVIPTKTSFSDLERAPFLNAFIKEVLRVHPSAGFTREVADPKGVTLGGVNLPQGAEIWFIPPLLHNQERYFERALEFIPERWEEGSKLGMDPRAYFPFSLGPRNCAGTKLAQLELRCFLTEIIRRWDIEYDDAQGPPRTYLSMTLDPGRLFVRVKPRSDAGARMWSDKIELMEG
ncbi:cytochrome P450 [Gonapodya prolifera JEL478]|uniref:Cytochrome P450 n=1 Tax=Gonapodya prolifera (strain JEL478) TaxID=1344416 RepID=A0A139AW59_GONPJ|nr:cytochrome P450 [Gonapodya prolifera JEL478]|eukprot:KXS20939.1 cytochrome P450 [Gonapodya prolifera JEL478]